MKLSNQQADALAQQIIRKSNETREKEEKAYLSSKVYKDAIAKDMEAVKKQLPKTGVVADYIAESDKSNIYGFTYKLKQFIEEKHKMKESQYSVKYIHTYNNTVKQDLIVASINADDIKDLLANSGYTL